eukprot:4754837-Prymnesium_polylepis.1
MCIRDRRKIYEEHAVAYRAVRAQHDKEAAKACDARSRAAPRWTSQTAQERRVQDARIRQWRRELQSK